MTEALDIAPEDLSRDIGALPTIGGLVTADQPFSRMANDTRTYAAIYLKVGVAPNDGSGVVVVEDATGTPIVIYGVMAGEYIPVAKARRVLSSVTINTITYTTNCSNIVWLGGCK